MSEERDPPPTVVIRRPAKVATDERGRSVWLGDVEETEFELMSTSELKQVLAANNARKRDSIEALAASEKQGVVARDNATGIYDVVSEQEIQSLIDRALVSDSLADRLEESLNPAADSHPREFTLVHTQALRIMLEAERREPTSDDERDESPGFDPYDRS